MFFEMFDLGLQVVMLAYLAEYSHACLLESKSQCVQWGILQGSGM